MVKVGMQTNRLFIQVVKAPELTPERLYDVEFLEELWEDVPVGFIVAAPDAILGDTETFALVRCEVRLQRV